MKTLLCLLLISFSALAQPKNTQRYQIVDLKPALEGGFTTVIMIDGETGKTWELMRDSSVEQTTNIGTFRTATHFWSPLPVEKVLKYKSDTEELILSPDEKKK